MGRKAQASERSCGGKSTSAPHMGMLPDVCPPMKTTLVRNYGNNNRGHHRALLYLEFRFAIAADQSVCGIKEIARSPNGSNLTQYLGTPRRTGKARNISRPATIEIFWVPHCAQPCQEEGSWGESSRLRSRVRAAGRIPSSRGGRIAARRPASSAGLIHGQGGRHM